MVDSAPEERSILDRYGQNGDKLNNEYILYFCKNIFQLTSYIFQHFPLLSST
jgi:hypothetical protein